LYVTLLFIYALIYQMRSIHSHRIIVNECPLLLRVVKLDSPLLGVWTSHLQFPFILQICSTFDWQNMQVVLRISAQQYPDGTYMPLKNRTNLEKKPDLTQ
jgi:hypothetical protein